MKRNSFLKFQQTFYQNDITISSAILAANNDDLKVEDFVEVDDDEKGEGPELSDDGQETTTNPEKVENYDQVISELPNELSLSSRINKSKSFGGNKGYYSGLIKTINF